MAEVDDTEKWTRFSVNIAHAIGGTVLTVFGAGAAVAPLGELEGMALNSGFNHDKISPSVNPNQNQTPPVITTQSQISVGRNIEVSANANNNMKSDVSPPANMAKSTSQKEEMNA